MIKSVSDMFKEALSEERIRFELRDELFLPKVSHPGDAGADIRCYIPTSNYTSQNIISKEVNSRFTSEKIFLDGVEIKENLLEEIQKIEPDLRIVILEPGQTKLVDTGFKIALPKRSVLKGYILVAKIYPRSGLGVKLNVSLANCVGIIDSGYRDWVRIGLTNQGRYTCIFTYGARVAQLVVEQVKDLYNPDGWEVVDSLDEAETTRGLGGFNSTGVA